MYEMHINEQYFFNSDTLKILSNFLQNYNSPAVLCAPMVGKALIENNKKVKILDIDLRFSNLNGFIEYNIIKPKWLGEKYDIILCDPPFFNISLSRLFKAVRLLSMNCYDQKLLITYLKRRESNIIGTFNLFNLQPTGFCPEYQTVKRCNRNEIEFYSNLDDEELKLLNDLNKKIY